MIKKLWKVFTKIPEYNEKEQNPIIRFISTYPNISMLIFFAIKSIVVNIDKSEIVEFNISSLIMQLTLKTLFFQGMMFEIMPNTIFSPLIQGVVQGAIMFQPHVSYSSVINQGMTTCFASFSRRKYPLYIVLLNNLTWLFFLYGCYVIKIIE